MKALTLTQPWASLVAIGAKANETRSWKTDYRGLVAIHAAKGWTRGDRDLCYEAPFFAVLRGRLGAPDFDPSYLPFGAVVAVATLADCVRIAIGANDDALLTTDPERRLSSHSDEYAFGNYDPGRFAWLLADVVRLKTPIPCKGALGLWTLPPEIERQL